MRRVTLVLLFFLTVSLVGCAGGPQGPDHMSSSDRYSSGRDQVLLAAPANQLARRLADVRRRSMEMIRQALLDEHERWAGTPYVLGGEGPRGIDCSALVQQVFSEAFALDLPRTTEGQVNEGTAIDRSELKSGDLVFFRPPGIYRHVGIYVGDGYFLHASSSQGVILSRLDNAFWARYYWQARRPLDRIELAQRVLRAQKG